MFDPVYMRQSQLLLRCLPEIGKDRGVYGSTAIRLANRLGIDQPYEGVRVASSTIGGG